MTRRPRIFRSQAQVDAAKAAMAAAQAARRAARADNERVQALEDYTNVIAPLDGVVIWRYADTGALIQGGTNSNSHDLPIVRISQSSLLRLRVPVPEDDVRFVHDGDELTVRVDAIDRVLHRKIVRFTRDVNFETRTMETEIDVENRDLSISPGMYANTMLRLDKSRMPLPFRLKPWSEWPAAPVYVLDGSNHVHVRTVQVGIEGQKLAEITSGLEPGERVILGGQEKYQEGEEVSPDLRPSTPPRPTRRPAG